MAVKWIGNAGSHRDVLAASDVITGAEHFGFALRLLYDRRDAELTRSANEISKRRGVPIIRRASR